MDNGPEDRIRERAFALWRAEGEPAGRELDFWLQAERELAEGSVEGPVAGDGADDREGLIEAPETEPLLDPEAPRLSIEQDG